MTTMYKVMRQSDLAATKKNAVRLIGSEIS